jgi:hypothetical protein
MISFRSVLARLTIFATKSHAIFGATSVNWTKIMSTHFVPYDFDISGEKIGLRIVRDFRSTSELSICRHGSVYSFCLNRTGMGRFAVFFRLLAPCLSRRAWF